jgi:hypothetical protein
MSSDISLILNGLNLNQADSHQLPIELLPMYPPLDYEHKISICVDFSNIRYFTTQKVDICKLVKKLEGERNVFYRGVAGSGFKEDVEVINYIWKSCGYYTAFQIREPNGKEKFIDEVVKNMVQKSLLNRHMVNLKIVLVTGDGNKPPCGLLSFPEMVEYAITLFNRDVEVWALSNSIHDDFLKLRKKYPTKLTIIYLDMYKDELYSYSAY